MAGILDEVMDGIAVKEKQEGQTPQTTTPTTTQAQTEPAEHKQAPPATEGKPMNTYSDDFKNRYGKRK